ncbi:MAG: 3-deoxy-D-manno-octulosonic acid transferase [Gammaproteobacteria bacterium]|nr:3-deoxy-D-manno-octulosonic acid transferase [Gammaproteobacteria bacterium]
MSLIYRTLWYLLLPFGVIWHLIFVWRRPEFRFGFWQRYGWVPVSAEQPLVVHAASVGEINAVADLLCQVAEQTTIPLLVTTTTATGRDRCLQLFGHYPHINHAYMPFDIGLSQRLFWRRVKPRGLLLVETELWPNMLRLWSAKQVPIWLINGRLSKRSARGYGRLGGFSGTMLACLQRVLVQDKASARRFVCLGAEPQKLQIMGSVKFDLTLPTSKVPEVGKPWLDADDACWVCGSTREGEEATLLQAWARMDSVAKGLLVLVPRHPQRFAEVADLCEASGLPWQRFTEGGGKSDLDQSGRRVLLVDAMGLLIAFYRLADVVFVGGSLVTKGGHNPLEPAALGKPVLMGPHTFNFATVCELLQKVGNLHLTSASQLLEQIPQLLANPELRLSMGQAGAELVAQRRGATAAYVSMIKQQFGA